MKILDLGNKEIQDADKLMITVCDKCLTASCWKGIFLCYESDHAGTTEKSYRELLCLDLEHPCYFSPEE